MQRTESWTACMICWNMASTGKPPVADPLLGRRGGSARGRVEAMVIESIQEWAGGTWMEEKRDGCCINIVTGPWAEANPRFGHFPPLWESAFGHLPYVFGFSAGTAAANLRSLENANTETFNSNTWNTTFVEAHTRWDSPRQSSRLRRSTRSRLP